MPSEGAVAADLIQRDACHTERRSLQSRILRVWVYLEPSIVFEIAKASPKVDWLVD